MDQNRKYRKKPRKTKNKKFSNRISQHFSKRDFECKSNLSKNEFKISLGLVGGLELLRSLANTRIDIIKGYQCQASCEIEKEVKRNYHAKGLAADIRGQNMDLKTLLQHIEKVNEFKGIGINIEENYIHVDTRKEDDRIIWVEINKKDILITTENKETYLPDIPLQSKINPPQQPD